MYLVVVEKNHSLKHLKGTITKAQIFRTISLKIFEFGMLDEKL